LAASNLRRPHNSSEWRRQSCRFLQRSSYRLLRSLLSICRRFLALGGRVWRSSWRHQLNRPQHRRSSRSSTSCRSSCHPLGSRLSICKLCLASSVTELRSSLPRSHRISHMSSWRRRHCRTIAHCSRSLRKRRQSHPQQRSTWLLCWGSTASGTTAAKLQPRCWACLRMLFLHAPRRPRPPQRLLHQLGYLERSSQVEGRIPGRRPANRRALGLSGTHDCSIRRNASPRSLRARCLRGVRALARSRELSLGRSNPFLENQTVLCIAEQRPCIDRSARACTCSETAQASCALDCIPGCSWCADYC